MFNLKTSDPLRPQSTSPPPPNYSSRSVQTRLLVLVFLFMTILMLMSEARNPKYYQWLWKIGGDRASTPSTEDLKLSAPEQNSPASSSIAGLPTDTREPDNPIPRVEKNEPELLRTLPQWLDSNDVESIKDDRMLRPEELDSWFKVWERMRSDSVFDDGIPEPGQLSYTQLFSQTSEYRGKLLSLRGMARGAYFARAAANSVGVPGYYVFWVHVDDDLRSPPRHGNLVMAVYSTELPRGFPQVTNRSESGELTPLNEWMQFTGVLFKRWVYASEGGPELVPLVLGKVTDWHPTAANGPVAKTTPPTGLLLLCLVAIALMIGLTIATWAYRRSRWSRADFAPASATPSTLPAFPDNQDRGDVHKRLDNLAKQDLDS